MHRIVLWGDLVNAVRFLKSHQAFSLAGIMTLALGIGATTSLFSVAHAIFLRELPVPRPEELVLLRYVVPPRLSLGIMTGWSSQTEEGEASSGSLPYPFYRAISENRILDSVFAFSYLGGLTCSAYGRSQRVNGQLVSGNFFSELGIEPHRGRLILPADDAPDSDPVVVLGYGFWRSGFGGDPAIVGRSIRVNRRSFVVVGIAPAGFEGTVQLGQRPSLFIPLKERRSLHHFGSNTERGDYWWLRVMARLGPETPRRQAEEGLSLLFQNQTREVLERHNSSEDLAGLGPPRIRLEYGGQGETEQRQRLGSTVTRMGMLVGLLLLLSSINLAALLISKAGNRRRELAIKLALGSARWGLFRQLSLEVLVLAVLAGGIGLIFSLWTVDWMVRLLGTGAPRLISVNWPVLLFALGVSLLTGLVVGGLTAFRVSAVDPGPALKEADGKLTLTRSSVWIGRSLVGVQVSLAIVLLVTSGLFLGTLRNLMKVEVGFDPNQLLVFDLEPERETYSPEEREELFQRIVQELEVLPAVRSVSYSAQRMIDGSNSAVPFVVRGESTDTSLDFHYAGPGFLSTMGIPLQAGRDFEIADGVSRPTAIISQSLAERYFPGQNPIGQIIQPALSEAGQRMLPGMNTGFEIVGIAGDTKFAQLRDEIRPTVFLPALQNAGFMRQAAFVVRLATSPERALPLIEKIIQRLDSQLPLLDARPYTEQIRESVEQEIQFARMSSLFSTIALFLVTVGIYGTLSNAVSARLREFGIRIALGADGRRLQGLVLRELGAVVGGILVGIPAAFAVTRSLSALLYGLESSDPGALASGVLVMLSVSLGVALIPARRASRTDPVTVLRNT